MAVENPNWFLRRIRGGAEFATKPAIAGDLIGLFIIPSILVPSLLITATAVALTRNIAKTPKRF